MSNNDADDRAVESAPIARGKRLKNLRKLAALTRDGIEEKYGISAATLRSWEDGRFTGLTSQGARRIVEMLRKEGIQCSIGWLLSGAGSTPIPQSVIYKKPQSNEAEDIIDPDNIFIQTEIELFHKHYPEAISMKINDDGMAPYFLGGDWVTGIRCYNEQIKNLIGLDCIVETQAGDIYLRQLCRGSQMGHYSLVCSNLQTSVVDPIIYNIEILSAAPIIWHRKKYVNLIGGPRRF